MKRLIFALSACCLMASLLGCARHSVEQEGNVLQFILTAPDNTQKAILATSYDNFAPHVATRIGGRRWRVTLDICGESSDSLRYYTVIDGVIVIPDCHLREPDGFGGFNCVYEFAKYSQESRYEHK